MDNLLVFLLDRSSSMTAAPTIEGFNRFLTLQQYRMDDCALYYATFTDYFEPRLKFVSIFDAPKLDDTTYIPQGNTALFDSIRLTVKAVEEHINTLPVDERPVNVTFVCQTDGGNNGGNQGADTIKAILDTKRRAGWRMIFLAESDMTASEKMSYAARFKEDGRTALLDPDTGLYEGVSVGCARALGYSMKEILPYSKSNTAAAFEASSAAILDALVTGNLDLSQKAVI